MAARTSGGKCSTGWKFLTTNGGVTSIEYGLIAAALGIAIAVGTNILGPAVDMNFRLVADSLDPPRADASLITTSVSPLKE